MVVGAFVQRWMSFAGSNGRSGASQMSLEPIAAYLLPDAWSIGYAGNVLASWKEDGDDAWTVPIGFGVAKVLKVGKLPPRVLLAGQYMPIRPDVVGRKGNLRPIVAPVLSKLVRGNPTDPSHLRFGLGP